MNYKIMDTKKRRRKTGSILFVVMVAFVLILVLFPVVWMGLTSIKTKGVLFQIPPPLIFKPVLKHWIHVLSRTDFVRYYMNSLIIGAGSLIFTLSLASLSAYSLARFDIPRKENIAFFILSVRMMPPAAVVIPIYLIYYKLRLLDTLLGLTILYGVFNLPFGVWILRGFFEDIPRELEEAAMVDGCSPIGAFIRVMLPIARPGLLATSAYCFVLSINEFFFANVLTGNKARPVSVAVTQFLPTGVRGTEYGNACVAALLIMIPPILIYAFFQRFLIRGMTLGALKE